VTAPLWLLFLVLGILISLQARFVRPEYFPKGFSLFPQWPAQDPVLAAWVFAGTMGILIAPKLLAWILLLTQGTNRRRSGGGITAFAGLLIETLLAGLIAPVMMIFQSQAVGEILLGRDSGWQVQRRDDGGLPRSELIGKYAWPTLLGAAMAVVAYAVSVPLLFWMAPVIAGLLLCIPIAMLSSTQSSLNARLLRTPEQAAPPEVLVRANELAKGWSSIAPSPLQALRDDGALLETHLINLPDDKRRNRGEVDPNLAIARAKIEEAESFEEAAGFLTPRETFAVLGSQKLLRAMCGLPLAGERGAPAGAKPH
jgi:membrane glycosyltransferase